ncbi:glycosyltransferase family 4 protein [Zobellia galactanivorans]|uniref:glycosyltransferase family 4 protein n=1 Tax=Zobellia galactanivorans (strain DSM 12802 / CCUG 47099 / CIP 106680 / NCIMB 13871 / Dsij) TaxID=63186 RepID=UPI001C06A222|nr:glycosyltransferase family 4 protein [Zobellia galactanivorans]MBU3024415.1 glycosyltransferase family 4 protein [Zobellia galactanivorans]
MQKKRIAFVIYSLSSGGAERVISTLANSLEKEFEIFIITLVKTQPFYPLEKSIRLLYCAENPKERTNPIKSAIDGLNRIRTLSKIIKSNNIRLTISFMTSSNIYSVWASKWCGIPCIISERANHNIDKPPKLLALARDYSYKLCNYLVVQTEGNKMFYHKTLSPSKIIVIPNPLSKSLASKRNLDQVQKEKIILNVGSFKEGKAQDLLIRAFSKLNTDNWRLVFVGDGKNRPKFVDLVNKLMLQDNIQFVGKQQEIHEYYNKSSLFVFTSEHEGFPNALLEALSFGIPSISTNCEHGPSDLIKDGYNGFLIPVGDQPSLEQKMALLMKDTDLQHKFRKNAISSTKRYEVDSIISLWRNYINELI